MRASEFIFNEGKASRRKQASMNAKRRMANTQPTVAPAVQPTASTGTSAPAVAPTQQVSQPSATPTIDNPVNPNVKPGGSKEAQAYQAQRTAAAQPEAEPSTDPAFPDYADTPAVARAKARLGMSQSSTTSTAPASTAPQQSSGSSMMNALKSAGKGIANKFSKQGKISARTDQLFMDKFLKDMGTAEQTSTGLRGQPFDVKTWVDKYLAQNKWSAGDQHEPLYKAVAANYKPGIAKAMAAIGKNNNLASTTTAQGPMSNMASQLTKTNPSGAGTASTVNVSNPNNPNQAYATQPAAGSQQAPVTTAQTAVNPFGQMTSQLTKPAATTQPAPQIGSVAPAAPATKAQPIKIGGQTLDPNDPADAKMIAMLQKQGKV
jgi:hypothetical protein